ncbi:MAG: caspase family protein [Hormoscilla sp. SP12CHS1]|nr:caspase family protein [Hormoscilla sp. SP12CHS1]
MMGKTFIIATGINQYQVFQPLNYAQHDAQAVWDFGVYQAGLSPSQCLLLTDTSGQIEGHSTYPNRETIEGWLDQICRKGGLGGLSVTAADHLWWFFSGYGVSYEGSDYLMPIEGNPSDVEGTGISMRSLFTRLKQMPTSNILVMLDINRASSIQSGSLLGSQTSQLAREMEIPTLLSCQPGQFCQETSDLRHGLFTAALLEGLRSGQCNTLVQLEEYLGRRLQELSDCYMRPCQQPLMVVTPPEKVNQAILPLDSPATTAPSESTAIRHPAISKTSNEGTVSSACSCPEGLGTRKTLQRPMPEEPELQEMHEDAQFWRQLILTSAGLAIILIAGVFFRNKDLLISTPDGDGVSESPQQIESGRLGEVPLQVVEPPAESAKPPLRSQAAPWERDAEPPAFQPIESPIDPPKPAPTAVKLAATEQENRDLLGKARTALGLNQASKYSSAIDMARSIKPGEPLYAEARQDIEFWSRAIMDIAVGRSKMGKFNDAIAAAKLVPSDSDSYQSAEDAIALWTVQAQQQRTNQAVLNQAKELIIASQASSYKQAIDLARSIPQGQPNYFAAQKLINQWSNDILAIARSRADKNSLKSAITAASLVPEDTKAYEQAKGAIATWQERLKQE